MDVKDDVKALVKAGQLLFNLVLYFHMMSCIWFFTCDFSKIWIPTTDWLRNPVIATGTYYEEYSLS